MALIKEFGLRDVFKQCKRYRKRVRLMHCVILTTAQVMIFLWATFKLCMKGRPLKLTDRSFFDKLIWRKVTLNCLSMTAVSSWVTLSNGHVSNNYPHFMKVPAFKNCLIFIIAYLFSFLLGNKDMSYSSRGSRWQWCRHNYHGSNHSKQQQWHFNVN